MTLNLTNSEVDTLEYVLRGSNQLNEDLEAFIDIGDEENSHMITDMLLDIRFIKAKLDELMKGRQK